jgi:hypothetical protein
MLHLSLPTSVLLKHLFSCKWIVFTSNKDNSSAIRKRVFGEDEDDSEDEDDDDEESDEEEDATTDTEGSEEASD